MSLSTPLSPVQLMICSFLWLITGLFVLPFPQPFWWAGPGLILASFGLFWHAWQQHTAQVLAPTDPYHAADPLFHLSGQRWFPLLMDVVCVFLMAVVVFAMLPEASLGQRPINHDHSVHFAKIWEFQDRFLAQGRLWGWSHQWFAGYPVNYLYPFGADLFVLLIRGLSLGFLDLGQSYAVAFALHWILLGYAVYRCSLQEFSRIVGIIAALLLITDIGSYRMGGWVFTAKWGVWPMNLSVAFALLAISHLQPILTQSRWHHIAGFGGWMGLALLTHPMQLIHFVILLPVALFTHWLTLGSQGWLTATARLILASILGVALGGLWLFPFLSTQAYSHSYGAPWWDTVRMATGIYDLDLLGGSWSLLLALGIVGLLALFFSRRFFSLLLALLSFVLLLSSSSSFVQSFHLTDLFQAFQKVQFQRFAVLLKPYLFIAGAYMLVSIFQYVFTFHSTTSSAEVKPKVVRRFIHLFLVGALTTPILHPLFNLYVERHISHIYRDNEKETVETTKDDIYFADKQTLVTWAKQQFPQDQKRGFFRLALHVGEHEHRFFDLGPALSVPVYKVGFTPATNYRYKMEQQGREVYKALDVLYVLSLWALPASDYSLVRKFGKLYLYQFRHWDHRPFDILDGSGQVSLQSFTDEDIILRASAGSQGKLRLHVSYFPRWQVTHNGSSMPIYLSQIPGHQHTAFMTVDLKEGVYHFQFRRNITDILSLVVFGLGGILWLLLLLANHISFFDQRLHELQQQLSTWETRYATPLRYSMFGLAGVFVLGMTGLAIWQPKQHYQHPFLQQKSFQLGYDFQENLLQAKASTGTGMNQKPCRVGLDRFYCGADEWQHVNIRQVRLGADQWKQCIWMHPQDNAPVSLTYTQARVGNAITGYFGIAMTGLMAQPSPVVFEVKVQGKSLYRGMTQKDATLYHYNIVLSKEIHNKPVVVTFSSAAASSGRRHFCFHAQGIRVQKP